jgi:DNA-binding CsgD family transcriptional regulator
LSDTKEKRSELTLRQHEILKILESEQLGSIEIAKKLKGSPGLRVVQIDLMKLEKIGRIRREGQTRSTTWRAVK